MKWPLHQVQVINCIQFHLKNLPAYGKASWAYLKSGALWRDLLKFARCAFFYLQQLPRWRLAALGAALYLLLPLSVTPYWQLQLLTNQPTDTEAPLQSVLAFYQKHGEAVLPALQAQLELDKLRRMEQQLIADNTTFSSQARDDQWAEATEFMIAHLAQSVTDNQLRILDSECRNNLCRIELYAPKGLTPQFQAQVLKYASTLKRGDLEFQDLVPGKDRIMLELKSDKKLKYGFWTTRQLEPAAKAQWQQDVRAWLQPTTTATKTEKTVAGSHKTANSAQETPTK
jgi:hypothetical protein